MIGLMELKVRISKSPLDLEIGAVSKLPLPEQLLGNATRIWRSHWRLNTKQLKTAIDLVTRAYGTHRLPRGFGLDTFLESVGMFHAAVRWLLLSGQVLSATKGLSGEATCDKLVGILAAAINPEVSHSSWINGLTIRRRLNSASDLAGAWNRSVKVITAELLEVRNVEQLERLIVKWGDKFSKHLLCQFATAQIVHVDYAHGNGLSPTEPLHHAIHMIEGFGVDAALENFSLIFSLNDRYDVVKPGGVRAKAYAILHRRLRARIGMPPDVSPHEVVVFMLRDQALKVLRKNGQSARILESGQSIKLGKRLS